MSMDRTKPAIVYVATNVGTGKQYVGVTTKSVEQRRISHARGAARHINKGRFHRAIRKYGIGSFTFDVLAKCATCAEALAEEKRQIAARSPAYNCTRGGEGALGYKHTRSAIRKMRAGPISQRKTTVCLNDSKRYDSASAAARAYGLDGSSVVAVCNRKRLQVGGLVFRYQGDCDGGLREATQIKHYAHASRTRNIAKARASVTHNGRDKPVRCAKSGRTFSSIKAAAAYYGKHPQTIADICHGRRQMRNRNQLWLVFGGEREQ